MRRYRISGNAVNIKVMFACVNSEKAILKKMKHIASINKSFDGALGGYFV